MIEITNQYTQKLSNKELSEDTLDYISKLALIELKEEEKEEFILQLEKILEYFNQLNDLNTDDIEPTRHPIDDLNNVFREDIAGESLFSDEALKNAKYTKEGYFKAPRVLKDKS